MSGGDKWGVYLRAPEVYFRVLDIEVMDAREYMNIPDPDLFSDDARVSLLRVFDSLSRRPIKSIFEEVERKDRQELDRLVLKALGLEAKEYLKPIYGELTELVRERIEIAEMRKKVNKLRTQIDENYFFTFSLTLSF